MFGDYFHPDITKTGAGCCAVGLWRRGKPAAGAKTLEAGT